MNCAIDEIVSHAKKIASGDHETVKPGMPAVINAAAAAGDAVWQGDLLIEVVSKVPDGYVKAKSPSTQLVPGSTQGSRHCLDSLSGAEVFLPRNWPDVEETLQGPCLLLTQDRTVTHPTHGDVTIAAGHTILCSYQREWDATQRRQRLNAD